MEWTCASLPLLAHWGPIVEKCLTPSQPTHPFTSTPLVQEGQGGLGVLLRDRARADEGGQARAQAHAVQEHDFRNLAKEPPQPAQSGPTTGKMNVFCVIGSSRAGTFWDVIF